MAQRLRQPIGQHRILLDGRDRTAPRKKTFRQYTQPRPDLQDTDGSLSTTLPATLNTEPAQRRIKDGVKGIAINEEILSQHPIGMEPATNAPVLDLR